MNGDSGANTPVIPNECLWTVGDVAAFLRCSKSWVYKATEDGTLPTVRMGWMVRFEPAAIRAYVARASVAPLERRLELERRKV